MEQIRFLLANQVVKHHLREARLDTFQVPPPYLSLYPLILFCLNVYHSLKPWHLFTVFLPPAQGHHLCKVKDLDYLVY